MCLYSQAPAGGCTSIGSGPCLAALSRTGPPLAGKGFSGVGVPPEPLGECGDAGGGASGCGDTTECVVGCEMEPEALDFGNGGCLLLSLALETLTWRLLAVPAVAGTLDGAVD